jgi:Ras-related protein Rab-8A
MEHIPIFSIIIMSKQPKKNYDLTGKVVILGDSAVGKTNILLRFTEGEYRPSHLATIGVDFKNKSIDIEGRILRFQLWDTAGQ